MADTQSYASRLADDTSLESLNREHRTEGINNCGPIWKESQRLKRFAARDQWPERSRMNTTDDPNRKSARLTVPETSRVIAAFSGRQILQRVEREYIPRNQETARWADTLTRVDKAVCQACDGEQVDSAAFRDGPGIQGISWVRWFVDDWTHEKPQLRYETVPIWQMMWPATRQINLNDRAWHRWGSWWPQSTVKSRWASKYDEIKILIGSKQWTSIQQSAGQSSRIPWTGGAGNKPLTTDQAYDPKTRCFWVEYEEFRELITMYEVAQPIDPNMSYDDAMDLNKQRIIAMSDPTTAESAPPDPFESKEMSSADLASFKRQRLAVHGEDVPSELIARKQRMSYKYMYICGDVILDSGDIEQKCFTFQSMAAEVVELDNETKYISLLSDLTDAQKMVNYMMSALIRDIQINPKGVLFIEQGLFRDKNEALTAFTSAGGVIEIPRGRMVGPGGNKPWDYQAGGTGNYSTKLESMLSFYREAIPRLAGFNPAALGQLGTDIRRVSGEVVKQLTDATLTSNAERIDALRLYRREGGRIFLAFARVLWEPEDLIDFIGETDAYDDVLDPQTLLPVVDPQTGQPQRTFTIPPKSMWHEDSWKEIAIEEVQPTTSAMEDFWNAVQSQVALLQAPMPDTGQPLFQAEDWVKLLPSMPASLRAKMLARIKMQQKKKASDDAAAQQAQQQAQQSQSQTSSSDTLSEALSIKFPDLPPDAQNQVLVRTGLRQDGQGQGQQAGSQPPPDQSGQPLSPDSGNEQQPSAPPQPQPPQTPQ